MGRGLIGTRNVWAVCSPNHASFAPRTSAIDRPTRRNAYPVLPRPFSGSAAARRAARPSCFKAAGARMGQQQLAGDVRRRRVTSRVRRRAHGAGTCRAARSAGRSRPPAPLRCCGDARPERPQPRAHRAVKSAARGTAGSAIAPPTRRRSLTNAPASGGGRRACANRRTWKRTAHFGALESARRQMPVFRTLGIPSYGIPTLIPGGGQAFPPRGTPNHGGVSLVFMPGGRHGKLD